MERIALVAFWASFAVVVYVYAAYPVLLKPAAWIAMARQRNSSAEGSGKAGDAELPSVSLVIAAYNEESVIGEKLQNCLQLDYPRDRLQILVGSDGSTDRTVEHAQRFPGPEVRVMELPRSGKAQTLNRVLASAAGQVLCFCDANVMCRKDSLRRLVARLADPSVGAASADVRLDSSESSFGWGELVYYRVERAVQNAESHVGSMMGVDGGMYAVRRELFQPVPADTILDDFVISMNVIRQGRRVVYEPAAVATENGTPSARDEFRRRIRIAAGAVQSIRRRQFPPLSRPIELWQYVSHKLLRWLGPVWLAALLVSSGVLAAEAVKEWWAGGVVGWPNRGIQGTGVRGQEASLLAVYCAAFAAQLAFYGLALVATVSLRFQKTRLGGIPFYFTMSHVAMAIGLVKGLFNLQPVTWQRTERGERVPSC